MRRLALTEFQTSQGVELSRIQRDQLRGVAPSITISPSVGRDAAYDLTPGSWVGAVHLDGLDLIIRPKLPIEQVLFLISYAIGQGRWVQAPAGLAKTDSLFEAIIPGFTYQLRQALARGVLQGYRTVDDAQTTVRGQWRIGDQLGRRHGIAPPVEVTFDDFTEDIELNRLLRAAIARLLRMRVREDRSRWGLRAIEAKLAEVQLVPYDARRVPTVSYDRRSLRYRPAVELARLVLGASSFDLAHGAVATSAFLIDMNKVFEDFVVVALREALGVSDRVLVQGARQRSLHLDVAGRISLLPDISVWVESECVFVGDVKYKRLQSAAFPNADLYQLAAYAVATELPSGMLIYAAGGEEPTTHEVVHIGKRLEIVALDLATSPENVLSQVAALAQRIRLQANQRGLQRLVS